MIKVIKLFMKFIIATTIALFLNSCNIKNGFRTGEDGNGKLTTDVRNIEKDFSSIDVDSGIEVVLEQSKEQFVSVEADSNLQKLIDTKVYKGILYISPNGTVNPTKTIKVIVRLPKIEGLEASSGSKIKGIDTFKGDAISIDASSGAEIEVNLKYENVKLDSSSASSIKVNGLSIKLEISASSGSEINADELQVNEVNASASSGSNVKIHPILKLDGKASSGSSITYDIEPKSITKDESSGGNVVKK